MHKARPLPEMLDGEDWEVRNSGDKKVAYVDWDKREFVVPFENSAAAELTRAHEAMHVKISPVKVKKSKDYDFVTLQSVEDCRVWQGLRLADIKTDLKYARIYSDKELEDIFAENENLQHPQRLGDAIIATYKTGEGPKTRELCDAIEPKVGKIVDEIREKYFGKAESKGELPDFNTTVECAKELTKSLKKEFPEAGEAPGKGCDGEGQDNVTHMWVPGGSDGEETNGVSMLGQMTAEEMKEAEEGGIHSVAMKDWRYEGATSPSGTLRKIETPKLDQVIRFKTTEGIAMTPSDEGVIPTRMHRYATDMKLFSRKGKRRKGAAVLIDVSGSMSLSQAEVLEIIHQCPASIVAVYSGFQTDGLLRIVAENGRYSTKLKNGMPLSNIVDYPALQWLAKRKEKKKLWISDGWITACHEQTPLPEEIRKISRMLRQKNIERVGNVREMLRSGKLIDRSFDDGHEVGRGYDSKSGRVI